MTHRVTLSSNFLCAQAVDRGVLVQVLQNGNEICRVVPGDRKSDEPADVVAELDRDCRTATVVSATLAGELFLSLLALAA
jgi:hypothetical protein